MQVMLYVPALVVRRKPLIQATLRGVPACSFIVGLVMAGLELGTATWH
jgi:hypothetical protein